jgi:hypothetical protein
MPLASRQARAEVSGMSQVSQRIAVQVKTGCCGPRRTIVGTGGSGTVLRAGTTALSSAHRAQIIRFTDRPQALSTSFLIRMRETSGLKMEGYAAPLVKKCNTGQGTATYIVSKFDLI